jgi:DNA-binding CsgD family transcriptional regulator
MAVLSFSIARDARLSPAEEDVLRRMLGGQSNAEIAKQRRTSVRTVENQIAGLYRKLGVSSRRELITLGWIR